MVTDIHFHLAGVRNSSHIHISKELRNTRTFAALCTFLLLRKRALGNRAALDWALETAAGSSEVERVVALALDWVYERNGSPDPARTHFRISNDWVAEQVSKMPERMLFGASVNPNRADALDELSRVKEMGAVLIKLIPSSQDINLMDERHRPFFDRMKALELPLLCHIGVEHTIPPVESSREKMKLNGTDRLQSVLEREVTVIAAHCGMPVREKDGTEAYDRLRRLFEYRRYERLLYADVSASFVLPSTLRKQMAERVKNELPHDRLLFGSDFPMLPFPVLGGYMAGLTLTRFLKILTSRNPLDRNVHALRAFGFQECIFTNAKKILPKKD